MKQLFLNPLTLSAAVLIAAAGPGCKEKPEGPTAPSPRPVTVVKLKKIDPTRPLRLTGSVNSWKSQDVAFEVEGRVDFVVQPGTNLTGRWVEKGEVRVAGEAVARVDRQTYEISLASAKAAEEVAKQKQRTAEIELKEVLPAKVKAADAQTKRADAELKRYKRALETKAVAEVDVIRAQADFDGRQANLEEARAAIDAKKAEIESLRASEKEAAEAVRQANYNLERCTLFAPFTAEVSEVYMEAGGYARKGESVAHLVMMDPIEVDLAVSASTVDMVHLNDTVTLYPAALDKPVPGFVTEKATVADSRTRTFKITILTRNQLVPDVSLPPDHPDIKLPRINRFAYLMKMRPEDPNSRFYVEANRALRSDGKGGYFVWANPERNLADSVKASRVVTLRKIAVKPGQRERSFQGLFLMRELVDIGELKPGCLIAHSVPDSYQEGEKALLAQDVWSLRPGQLVDVVLERPPSPAGLYVPMNAVRPTGDNAGYVFLAVDQKARRVAVKVLRIVGELAQVEPTDAADSTVLKVGALLITDHVHFLQDGEPVQATAGEELQP